MLGGLTSFDPPSLPGIIPIPSAEAKPGSEKFMAKVELEKISKIYPGGVKAVDGIDLSIKDQEFIVLVGPSGCGKSTTLRMVAGLEEITGGTIRIGDRIVNDVPPKDRDIAMVFQSYALYPHMTVRENLEFGLRMRKVPSDERARRVASAAEILGMSHLLERKPKDLSGGQRQRVAVGRAIVREPAVFLFDEPLSNLDAKLRVQTRGEITKLQQQLGTTSVYVTHDQIEAMTMGQRITVMRAGKIQQVGTPREVYEQPANAFVAQFIGTPPMNIFQATVSGSMLRTSSFTLPLPIPLEEGRAVIGGIRPEHLTPADGQNGIRVVVDLVEPIGHETIAYASAGAEKLTAIFDPDSAPKAGDVITLSVPVDRIHLFDAKSEASLLKHDARR